MTIPADLDIPDRPFTALRNTAADVAIMDRMLERLRRHVADLTGGRHDDRFIDADDGAHHTIIVTDASKVRSAAPLTVVGFFGQARVDVDHAPIVDLEQRLISGMRGAGAPGVYHNVWWPGEGWGNLVLFRSPEDEAAWGRADPLHQESVRRSPAHYHSIRLHIGVVASGLPGPGGVRLLRTKYLDYGESPPWRATREGHGASAP